MLLKFYNKHHVFVTEKSVKLEEATKTDHLREVSQDQLSRLKTPTSANDHNYSRGIIFVILAAVSENMAHPQSLIIEGDEYKR